MRFTPSRAQDGDDQSIDWASVTALNLYPYGRGSLLGVFDVQLPHEDCRSFLIKDFRGLATALGHAR